MGFTPPLYAPGPRGKREGAERATPNAVEQALASEKLRRGLCSRLSRHEILFYICEFKGERGRGRGYGRPQHNLRLALALRERGRQPVEALVETVARRRAARLDVPLAVAQAVQAQLVRHLGGAHRVRQVLLVREH